MSHSDAIHGRHAAEPVPPAFVRSFTLTRGRTIPRVDLPFEATLVVTDKNSQSPVSGQHAEALALCDGRSVAEIAAEMNLPIGVVRVLVTDLAESKYIRVHTSTPVSVHTGQSPALSLSVLESVLNGISAL